MVSDGGLKEYRTYFIYSRSKLHIKFKTGNKEKKKDASRKGSQEVIPVCCGRVYRQVIKGKTVNCKQSKRVESDKSIKYFPN